MMVPQLNRRWRRLLLGLLPLPGLVMAGPLASAPPLARSDPAPVTLSWSTVSPPTSPPPLAYASAVYDSDTKTVVLFGGVKSDGALSNDTWVWNGTTWTDYPGSEVQAPPAREMASTAFDPKLHQLILFGGRGAGGGLLSDTWAWNGASWFDETGRSGGPAPRPRAGAAMAYDGASDLVLFGGTGDGSTADPARPAGTPGPTSRTAQPTSSATSPDPSVRLPVHLHSERAHILRSFPRPFYRQHRAQRRRPRPPNRS